MGMISENVFALKGVKLHVVPTNKYKTNTIVFKMKTPLNKENITKRALLPHVLQSNSKKFPTTAKLRSYLDELYGATINVDLAKKGEYHVISFTIEIANEKFLSDQSPLLQKAFEFLCEVVTNPNTVGGAFDQKTVENEKRSLKQRIQSVYDDKMRYSNVRLIQEMCKDEPYALYVHGNLEEVDAITEQNLYEYYKRALAEDELDLYVVGDVDSDEVTQAVSQLFQLEERKPATMDRRTIHKKEKCKKLKRSKMLSKEN